MNFSDKMDRIRIPIIPEKRRMGYKIIFTLIGGFIFGLMTKLFDAPSMPSILSSISSRLGIWIFIATLIAIYSDAPKLASIQVFAFLVSALFSYYLYTVLFLGFFPRNQIFFWSIFALASLPFAFVIWYSHGNGWFSNILTAAPTSLIMLDGYNIYISTLKYYNNFQKYENVLVSNRDYYNMIWTEIVYFCLILLILLLVPQNRKDFLIVLAISVIISLFLEKLGISRLLFSGMNTFL